jgi:hypothetical protein
VSLRNLLSTKLAVRPHTHVPFRVTSPPCPNSFGPRESVHSYKPTRLPTLETSSLGGKTPNPVNRRLLQSVWEAVTWATSHRRLAPARDHLPKQIPTQVPSLCPVTTLSTCPPNSFAHLPFQLSPCSHCPACLLDISPFIVAFRRLPQPPRRRLRIRVPTATYRTYHPPLAFLSLSLAPNLSD